MAELWFEIRSVTAALTEEEKGCPGHPPWWQPAKRAELRGPSYFCPSGSAWNPLGPRLTSSTFTEAGSFSRALTSSMERVKPGLGDSDCPAPVPYPKGGHYRGAPPTPKARCHRCPGLRATTGSCG